MPARSRMYRMADRIRRLGGPFTVEVWHPNCGAVVVSGGIDPWLGTRRKTPLPPGTAGARPTLAADGTRGGSKPVIQLASSGGKYIKATGLTGLVPAGTRPYMLIRFRPRDLLGVNVCDLQGVGDQLNPYTNLGVDGRLYILGADRVTGVAYDNEFVTWELWTDGTLAHLRKNGVDSTAAYAAATSAAVVTIQLGANLLTNISYAGLFLGSGYPGDVRTAALRSVYASEYPV